MQNEAALLFRIGELLTGPFRPDLLLFYLTWHVTKWLKFNGHLGNVG